MARLVKAIFDILDNIILVLCYDDYDYQQKKREKKERQIRRKREATLKTVQIIRKNSPKNQTLKTDKVENESLNDYKKGRIMNPIQVPTISEKQQFKSKINHDTVEINIEMESPEKINKPKDTIISMERKHLKYQE